MATVDGYNSHMAERKKRQRGKSIPNDRRRIAQRLVGERLGIERGWEDSALAPATFGDLPDFGEPKLSPEEASKIEAFLLYLTIKKHRSRHEIETKNQRRRPSKLR